MSARKSVRYRARLGDCREILPELPDNYFDSVVTDPPYGLGFMGKQWDSPGKSFVERKTDNRNTFDHVGGNHNPVNSADAARTRRVEGQRFQEWCDQWAAEVYRVLKPGAYLVAFGGTRTYHRMACAIEDAGFEIRDSLHWLYGSGFPKSLDVSKAIDKAAGAEREVIGDGQSFGRGSMQNRSRVEAGYRPTELNPDGGAAQITAPATEDAARWSGWGTALKPAHEPIVLARKPLTGTVAGNVLAHGTGALNIDGCRVGSEQRMNPPAGNKPGGASYVMSVIGMPQDVEPRPAEGRWPPNILLSHSADCAQSCASDCPVGELDRQSGISKSSGGANGGKLGVRVYGKFDNETIGANAGGLGDTGGASRFFPVFKYQAKAPKSERPVIDGQPGHPTVKPLELLRWLVRLATSPGGRVLDPFAGTGTTGEACLLEGFRCTMIEAEPAYHDLIAVRMSRHSS